MLLIQTRISRLPLPLSGLRPVPIQMCILCSGCRWSNCAAWPVLLGCLGWPVAVAVPSCWRPSPRRLADCWVALPSLAGTFWLPDRVPVAPLEQLNLKVPPSVLAHWRAQAQAQELSIRNWLMSIAGPTAAPGPAGGDGLADRVALLDATVAELREAVAQLQQARPSRSPRPAPAAPPAAPVPPPADLPADGIETAALAQLLGVKRHTMNARIRRSGGAVPGLVVDGWRCLGLRTPERGGPPRALWVPAAT